MASDDAAMQGSEPTATAPKRRKKLNLLTAEDEAHRDKYHAARQAKYSTKPRATVAAAAAAATTVLAFGGQQQPHPALHLQGQQ